jgi:hypothetical protein
MRDVTCGYIAVGTHDCECSRLATFAKELEVSQSLIDTMFGDIATMSLRLVQLEAFVDMFRNVDPASWGYLKGYKEVYSILKEKDETVLP